MALKKKKSTPHIFFRCRSPLAPEVRSNFVGLCSHGLLGSAVDSSCFSFAVWTSGSAKKHFHSTAASSPRAPLSRFYVAFHIWCQWSGRSRISDSYGTWKFVYKISTPVLHSLLSSVTLCSAGRHSLLVFCCFSLTLCSVVTLLQLILHYHPRNFYSRPFFITLPPLPLFVCSRSTSSSE